MNISLGLLCSPFNELRFRNTVICANGTQLIHGRKEIWARSILYTNTKKKKVILCCVAICLKHKSRIQNFFIKIASNLLRKIIQNNNILIRCGHNYLWRRPWNCSNVKSHKSRKNSLSLTCFWTHGQKLNISKMLAIYLSLRFRRILIIICSNVSPKGKNPKQWVISHSSKLP